MKERIRVGRVLYVSACAALVGYIALQMEEGYWLLRRRGVIRSVLPFEKRESVQPPLPEPPANQPRRLQPMMDTTPLPELVEQLKACSSTPESFTAGAGRRVPAPAPAYRLGRAISEHGETAVPYAIELLSDTNPQLKLPVLHLIELLGKHATPAIPALSAIARDSSQEFRWKAISILGAIGRDDSTAVQCLLDIFRTDTDAGIASIVTEMIPEMSVSVLPVLDEMLRDTVPTVRLRAVNALSLLGKKDDRALRRLGDAILMDRELRTYVIQMDRESRIYDGFGMAGERAVPILQELLALDDPEVKQYALNKLYYCLGPSGDSWIHPLIEYLGSDHGGIQGEAGRLLSRLGDTALPWLLKSLGDANVRRRISVIRLLPQYKEKTVGSIPTLIKMFHRENSGELREAILQALPRWEMSALPELIRLLEFTAADPVERQAILLKVIEGLGLYGERAEAAIPALVVFIEGDPAVRPAAFQALGRIGKPAGPALNKLLQHPKPIIRETAAMILKEIGS